MGHLNLDIGRINGDFRRKKVFGDVLICLFHLLKLYWENDRQLFSRTIPLTSNCSTPEGRIF